MVLQGARRCAGVFKGSDVRPGAPGSPLQAAISKARDPHPKSQIKVEVAKVCKRRQA